MRNFTLLLLFFIAGLLGVLPNIQAQTPKWEPVPQRCGTMELINRIIFRNISNHGNNNFMDNINIETVMFPVKLKQQGYIITPNPSDGWI